MQPVQIRLFRYFALPYSKTWTEKLWTFKVNKENIEGEKFALPYSKTWTEKLWTFKVNKENTEGLLFQKFWTFNKNKVNIKIVEIHVIINQIGWIIVSKVLCWQVYKCIKLMREIK